MNKKNIHLNNEIEKIYNKKRNIGIYIHIPFCMSKCYYCDFVSFKVKNASFIHKYIKALLLQIENETFGFKKEDFEKVIVDTIYIGGGTPSFIDEKYIEEILKTINKRFIILKDAEITIEANPESLTKKKIKKYKEIGINRISIGLQTTNDILLKKIGRPHTFSKFKEVFNLAKEMFRTNVDLIFALPDQTLEDVKKDVLNITNLDPDSFSIYSLIVEENTKFFAMKKQNKLNIPSEELERKMQKYIYKALSKLGYYRYEISNFSKKNAYSRHNTNTWKQCEYLGFGINASSYFKGVRFSASKNIKDFTSFYFQKINNFKLNNIEDKADIDKNKKIKKENIILIEEIQDIYSMMKEHVYLGLRMNKYYTKDFYLKFNKRCEDIFSDEFKKIYELGLIDIKKNEDFNIISLNKKGLDLANTALIYFI